MLVGRTRHRRVLAGSLREFRNHERVYGREPILGLPEAPSRGPLREVTHERCEFAVELGAGGRLRP